MSTIIERIQEIFPKDLELSSRHSYFQLQYFLIGKEPTNQSKMWQCLRELQARKENLENLDLQIEEEKDNLELQKLSIMELQEESSGLNLSEIKRKKIEIRIKGINRVIESIKKNITNLSIKKINIEEECEFFIKTFQNINKNEKLKHFDDLDSQKEYWGAKLLEKANLRLIANNNIDADLLETILSLPDDIQIKKFIINKINNLTSNTNDKLINQKLKNG